MLQYPGELIVISASSATMDQLIIKIAPVIVEHPFHRIVGSYFSDAIFNIRNPLLRQPVCPFIK